MAKVLYFNLLSKRSTLCRATRKNFRTLSEPTAFSNARLFEKKLFVNARILPPTSFSADASGDRARKYLAHLARLLKYQCRRQYRDIEFPWRSSAVDLPQRDIILSYANRGERGDNENLFRRFRVPCRACERCSLYLAAHTNVPHAWTPAPSHVIHIYICAT